jgi:alpha-galactosidase
MVDVSVVAAAEPDALWTYRNGSGPSIDVGPPVFQIDGRVVRIDVESLRPDGAGRRLANGTVEQTWVGDVRSEPGLVLRLVVRIPDDNAVVRFRYELQSTGPRLLTREEGADSLTYLSVQTGGRHATEVRLSDYDHLVHSYVPSEVSVGPAEFEAGLTVMGPLLHWRSGTGAALIAYEHGSQYPDMYVAFGLSPDGRVALAAVRGNYLHGHDLRSGYQTLWLHLAAVEGPSERLSAAYREFVLRRLADSDESRRPYVFYNTWNYQERVHHWTSRPYLAEMNAERMLAEIDVAHRIGIEVFVIDTGWYDRTGDWRVDRSRFPDGLAEIRDRLDGYGMRLGLWFGPTSAASSSGMLARNRSNRLSRHGEHPPARSIWETEESEELCLVSSYADDFADELIRCASELGVRYFKWDAIDQYGCDSPDHHHGNQSHSPAERADSYAFQQPLYLARVVERLARAHPDAIVDFDVTEAHRCVGLSFLSVGKYFLVNNGPYFNSFDIPVDRDVHWDNPNVFFHRGPARDWVVRTPLSYDTWIPSVLFLSHYLPDDPASNQESSVGSLVLGQNGLWGDLVGISDAGVDRMARLLELYKQVRADVTAASPRRIGLPGGQVEIHEKVSADTGNGVVVLFANGVGRPFDQDNPMRVRHVLKTPVSHLISTSSPDVHVTRDATGRAVIDAAFAATGTGIVFFGANPD